MSAYHPKPTGGLHGQMTRLRTKNDQTLHLAWLDRQLYREKFLVQRARQSHTRPGAPSPTVGRGGSVGGRALSAAVHETFDDSTSARTGAIKRPQQPTTGFHFNCPTCAGLTAIDAGKRAGGMLTACLVMS
jgi:hypothetical protein